ncbi:MAG: phosphotriesterase-related protein [Kiritimatiellae bacterium]|nr:phosphotriesterase-related protein [Kiritimatiellia bacterium]
MNNHEDASMSISAVRGPLSGTELGVILPHEHVFLDLTNQFTEPTDPEKLQLTRASITLENYGALRRNPYAIRDNLILDDLETAIREVNDYKAAGGATLVECTSIGIHRDPMRLRAVSERTGVHIVAGCGYYTYDTHPPEMTRQSAEAIAETMVRDLTQGIDGTGIRAGVIGEIGTSDPIRASECTSLMAAAIAHGETGAPLQIHTYPWGQAGLHAVRMLADAGVAPSRVVICHVDVAIDMAYIRDLLKTGVYVEFDNFGKEFYIDSADRIGFSDGAFASDLERVRALKILAEEGHARQLLVTNDICLKQMLCRYGGWGYGHILRHVVPMMAEEGIPQATIDRFVKDNPAEWLCPAAFETRKKGRP